MQLSDHYQPLELKQLQIMNPAGEITEPDLVPEINPDKLIQMYQTMVYSRVVDTKALQYQRQGRMLTYAPNLGQEATQVGSIAATEQTDWMASAFRELGAWLWREVPLYNIFLYWYGNERGSQMPEGVKVLPVSIPIASQMQHATGLAYASKLRGEQDVTISYVGDGGTSQGDFHEALNFASVMKTPNVFIIQNNQFAISVPRRIQTGAKTLAQKAVAYDIPGIQVDGNDILAVYAATKEAVERARAGNGPTLIECFTYRLGAHTTADDPTKYREDAEVDEWKKKDPIERLKSYLISNGHWSDEKENALLDEYNQLVTNTFKQVENSSPYELEDVFRYHFETMPPNLQEQFEERKAYFGKEA